MSSEDLSWFILLVRTKCHYKLNTVIPNPVILTIGFKRCEIISGDTERLNSASQNDLCFYSSHEN